MHNYLTDLNPIIDFHVFLFMPFCCFSAKQTCFLGKLFKSIYVKYVFAFLEGDNSVSSMVSRLNNVL